MILGQDVAKSKDARGVREPSKIRLHRAWSNSILHKIFSALQINDILLLLCFDLGEISNFWRHFHCHSVGRRTKKMGSALKPFEGLFLLPASTQAQIIVKGIRRNEAATIKTV